MYAVAIGQHRGMGAARRIGRPMGLPAELVWPARVDPTGGLGPTRGESRGPGWRRVGHGLYVPAETPTTVEQRIVEAAACLPVYGGVTGWAGLRWMGEAWFEGLDGRGRIPRPVVLATAGNPTRPRTGIAVSQERLNPRELTGHRGLTVTTAARSLFFEMRYARSRTGAVSMADMAAYSDLVSREEAVAYAAARPGWTGIGRMRDALDDMDENAWSPTEVAMRQVWCREAGLPRPVCNHPVFDLAGRHIGTPDLLDPVVGVVGEYDGALHLEGAQRARDVRREGVFRAAGLEYVTMLSADLVEPWGFVTRLHQAFARAARTPAVERAWTAQLPPWWIPTFTVEQRRALDDDQRVRLLRTRLRAG